MPQRYVPRRRALKALIQVYAPPRKVRIFWDEVDCPAAEFAAETATGAPTGASGFPAADDTSQHANACNSQLPVDQLREDVEECAVELDQKRRKLDAKRHQKRIWMGSVVEALSDVFTAIWANFVEPTDEFQTAAKLRPGSAKPASNANLVSRAFSSEKLVATHRSFRIHSQLMQAFECDAAALSDWQCNPAVNAYVEYLKMNPMIRECCLGLFSRLGTVHFAKVDQFVDTLRQVWFQPVNWEKPRCGYHHVCIGDFSPNTKTLSGMHNWFKFLIEEEQRRTRIRKWWSYEKDLHLISMGFSMKHPMRDVWYTKSTSSFLVGVPIDFELLLFTVITMVNPNKDTAVQIKDYEPLVVVPRCVRKTGTVVTAYFRESPQQT